MTGELTWQRKFTFELVLIKISSNHRATVGYILKYNFFKRIFSSNYRIRFQYLPLDWNWGLLKTRIVVNNLHESSEMNEIQKYKHLSSFVPKYQLENEKVFNFFC